MAAHQAPPSLGFSRREHWSGSPFPSPMQQSEKWKQSRSVMSDSSRPHGLQPTRLLCPWDFPGKSAGVGCHCLLWRIASSQKILAIVISIATLMAVFVKSGKRKIKHLKVLPLRQLETVETTWNCWLKGLYTWGWSECLKGLLYMYRI